MRGIEPIKYEKDFMKIKFKSDDNLPLGKYSCMCNIVRSVFQENGKYYPQVHLDGCFYENKYEDYSYCIV